MSIDIINDLNENQQVMCKIKGNGIEINGCEGCYVGVKVSVGEGRWYYSIQSMRKAILVINTIAFESIYTC